MEQKSISMKDILAKGGISQTVEVPVTPSDNDFLDEVPIDVEQSTDEIEVSIIDVDEVVIPEIKDVKGRLSDIIESIEQSTGLSVVPLNMAGIAPEVIKLQRHEIFELGDARYAMSKQVRENVVNEYVDRIRKSLTSGLPFVENLSKGVTYFGEDYRTIALSRVEWTIIISKFRRYKSAIRIKDGIDLVLEIYPEHAIYG